MSYQLKTLEAQLDETLLTDRLIAMLSARFGLLRVIDESRRAPAERGKVPVGSNTLTFEIVIADRGWNAARVAEAAAILDGTGTEIERRTGCRMLRFLATEAAVDEMISRFDDGQWGCDFEYMAGMFGAPNREHVVKRLEERLIAPDQPVSSRYLRTLAVLSLYLRHPDMRPAQTRENVGRIVSGELGRRGDMIDAAMEQYTATLIAALQDEGPRARAFSLAELLDLMSARSQSQGPAWPAGVELRGQLAAAFLDLPPARQRTLLEYQ